LEGAGFGPLMIDFGATALMALRRLGREPTELGGIAVTHLHGDHLGGFPFLMIDGMFNDVRHVPLAVVGPPGLEQRIAKLADAAYGDLAQREKPYVLELCEIAPGGRAELAGAVVHAFAADHMDPPEVPLCLRIELPGGIRVAFSGDTAMCPGLLEAAEGVDLLVAECSALAPPCGRHTTWQDWRETLPRLDARRVLLTHLGREVRESIDARLRAAPPQPELSFADDGMTITLGEASS
jgi:ribonuclease BN (tRNA processing enzyme)